MIARLLTEEPANFAERPSTLTDAHCEPKAVQQPHPPIWIGGNGPTRTLRAVARFAQCWNTPFTGPAELAASIEILHGHCADLGRDPSEITITAQVIHDPAVGAASTAAAVAELEGAGLDLAVIYLPETHHTAAEVERLATALG